MKKHKKTILFIGGNKETIPGILEAKKSGYKTVVLDGNLKSEAKNYSDFFISSSTYDHKKALKKSLSFNKNKRKIHAVMSISSDVPYTVSLIAKKLNLRGIPVKTAEIFSNKYLMKNEFKKIGLNVPNFFLIKTFQDLKNKISRFNFSVLKPVDSRGARGVFLINKNERKLKSLFNLSMKFSPRKEIILEEYLAGPQLSTESIINNYKVYTVGVSDRNYEYLGKYKPNIIENGSDMPSKFEKKFKKEIDKIIQKICKKLFIKFGTIKGDLVIHKNKIFIIEFAPRLSGGYFSSKMIPQSTNINLLNIAQKLHCKDRLNFKKLKIKKEYFVSQRYFFSGSGRVKKIDKISFKNKDDIVYFEMNIKKGEILKKITNHTDRVGQVITKNKNKKKTINFAKEIASKAEASILISK